MARQRWLLVILAGSALAPACDDAQYSGARADDADAGTEVGAERDSGADATGSDDAGDAGPDVAVDSTDTGTDAQVDDADASPDADDAERNRAPVARAGDDTAADEGVTVVLDGAESSDADGDDLEYRWSQTGGPRVLLTTDGSQARFIAPLLASELTFALVVNDGRLDSEPDSVTVSVANVAPVAHAGTDTAVSADQRFVLDSSASVDADALEYSWEQLEGVEMRVQDPGVASPTVTAGELPGQAVFRVTVTDNEGASDSDDVVVTVGRDWAVTPVIELRSNDGPTSLPPVASRSIDGDLVAGITPGTWTVVLFDASAPGAPQLLAARAACQYTGITAMGEGLLAVSCGADLILYDVSNRALDELGRTTLGDTPTAMAVGNGLVASVSELGLTVYSTRPRGLLRPTDSIRGGGRPTMAPGLLILDRGWSVVVYDTADPRSLVSVANIPTQGLSATFGNRLVLVGRRVEGQRELVEYELDPVRGATELSRAQIPTILEGPPSIAVDERFVYLLVGQLGLEVVSRGPEPTRLRGYRVWDEATQVDGVEIAGSLALLGDTAVNLGVVDAGAPRERTLPAYTSRVVSLGQGLIAVPGASGTLVYEVHPDRSPEEITDIALPAGALPERGVTSGQWLFLAGWDGVEREVPGVYAVDVENPRTPVVAGFTPTPGASRPELEVDGDLLYVMGRGDDEAGFTVLDIADPASPQFVARYAPRGPAIRNGDQFATLSRGQVVTYRVDGDGVEFEALPVSAGAVLGWVGDTLILQDADDNVFCVDSLGQQAPSRPLDGLPEFQRPLFQGLHVQGDEVHLHAYAGEVTLEIPAPGQCRARARGRDSMFHTFTTQVGPDWVSLLLDPDETVLRVTPRLTGAVDGRHDHIPPGASVQWSVSTPDTGHRVRCDTTAGTCAVRGGPERWEVTWTAPTDAGEQEIAISVGDRRVVETLLRDHVYVGP